MRTSRPLSQGAADQVEGQGSQLVDQPGRVLLVVRLGGAQGERGRGGDLQDRAPVVGGRVAGAQRLVARDHRVEGALQGRT
ncbi:hypothetical protein GA0115253_109371, partial [Streptomyces sp. Termitarium-T10T-6]